jgi:glycosyltransferase involved in cell wall biosynthesis
MAEEGVEIDLLTYGRGADVDIPGVRVIRIPSLRLLGPVPIGPSVTKLCLDTVLVFRLLGLLASTRYDFVHAHEEAVFPCVLLRPIFRFRLLYDMHSSLPQQLKAFGFTESRIITWLFERLERLSLRRANAVITISPLLAEYAKHRMPDPSRHFLIENSLLDAVRLARSPDEDGGDSDTIDSSHSEAFARRVLDRVPDDASLVVYAGTFEVYQGLDILLPAFAEVLAQNPRAFLLMVGGTPDQVSRYQALAEEVGVDQRCLIEERVDQATAVRFEQRADVLVSPRSAGTNTPLKIYGHLASGKPLVATRVPSHTQVLSESVCFLADLDPHSLAEGIRNALEDEKRRRSVVEAAGALYKARYSRDAYHDKIRGVLSLLSS